MTHFLPSPHSFSSARVSKSSRHDQVRALEPLNLAVERCATRVISCPLLGRRRYRENSWLHCTRYLIFRRNARSGQSPLHSSVEMEQTNHLFPFSSGLHETARKRLACELVPAARLQSARRERSTRHPMGCAAAVSPVASFDSKQPRE